MSRRPAEQTTEPFATAFKRLKGEADLSFREIAAETKRADEAEGRGLSVSYLVGLANGFEQPVFRSIELIAAALPGVDDPRYFVEYRLALWREAFDERVAFEEAVEHLAAAESLPSDVRRRLTGGHARPRGYQRARARRAAPRT